MRPIRAVIESCREKNTDLQNLKDACSSSPSRPPPSPSSISELRKAVAAELGLSRRQADKHHEASPWRYNLVREVLTRAEDPDHFIASWLKDGFPVGIRLPITPSGLLPPRSEERSLSAEALEDLATWDKNHASFNTQEDSRLPAHDLLRELVNAGHALLFENLPEAEDWLGSRVIISPLGDVVKQKPDGSTKHRLIMDLRASEVNRASQVQERQVLPRFVDHARDVALLSQEPGELGVLILDFKNAFMTLPLARAEMGYNASIIPEQITRQRKALFPQECTRGRVLLWRVLGFGGHSNPLSYSRAASFAARSAQALLFDPSSPSSVVRGRLQLYVDDPALTVVGTSEQQNLLIDLVLCWWLCLGIPLAWDKGSFSDARASHDWIGVSFRCIEPNTCTMTVPEKFRLDLLQLATRFAKADKKTASLADAHALCGRAGRLAQVVPEAKPFVSALFAALAGSIASSTSRSREAPPSKVATSRYRTAAAWLVALLKGDYFCLRHTLHLNRRLLGIRTCSVEFDASPWGGAPC